MGVQPMSKAAKTREQFETDIAPMVEYKVRLQEALELHRVAEKFVEETNKRHAAAVAEGNELRKRTSDMLEKVKESDPRQHFAIADGYQTLYFVDTAKKPKNICYHPNRKCGQLKAATNPTARIDVAHSESRLYRKCLFCCDFIAE